MEDRELEELWKRKRSQSVRLMEVSDLTTQLAEALDRKDQVSVEMLLSMREAPLRQMQEVETGIQEYLLSLPAEAAVRGKELLEGSEAQTASEVPLSEEVGKYRRRLQAVIALDKRMSLLMGGSQSFYNTFRE